MAASGELEQASKAQTHQASSNLNDHTLHLLEWYWMDVESGRGEVSFTLEYASFLRLHISKMTQLDAAASGSDDEASMAQRLIDHQLGALDSRITALPSLYSSTAFLQSGVPLLARSEVGLQARLQPGRYKLLFEYDARLTPNILNELCPKFMMELSIEPESSIRRRRGLDRGVVGEHDPELAEVLTMPSSSSSLHNSHLPPPICPPESRLPHFPRPHGSSLLSIGGEGLKFGPGIHSHQHGEHDEAVHDHDQSSNNNVGRESIHAGSEGTEVQYTGSNLHTYHDWFTLNAAADPTSSSTMATESSSPHGRLVWSTSFRVANVVHYAPVLFSRVDTDFSVGSLRLGLMQGELSELTTATGSSSIMFADIMRDGEEFTSMPLHGGLTYTLLLFEPFQQVRELTNGCIFFRLSFEVEYRALPKLHPALLPAHQRVTAPDLLPPEGTNPNGQSLAEALTLNHDLLCPFEHLPHTLNTPGYAGLHGNRLHLSGLFRADLEGSFSPHGRGHEVFFGTSFMQLQSNHLSMEAKQEDLAKKLLQPAMLRLYIPPHETRLKMSVELLRIIPEEAGRDYPAHLHFESLRTIDTSFADHMVERLDAGEYVLRFKVSPLAFHPADELCLGFRMEMTVVPLEQLKEVGECAGMMERRKPSIPECPNVPYSFGMASSASTSPQSIPQFSAPFVGVFDRAAWEIGSSTLYAFPLEIRYRETELDVQVHSDFGRAPVGLALRIDQLGSGVGDLDAELPPDPLLDTAASSSSSSSSSKLGRSGDEALHLDADRRAELNGHVIPGRQLHRNTQSLRTTLHPGKYTLYLRLLAPAPWDLLHSFDEKAKRFQDGYHVCVPYEFQLNLYPTTSASKELHGCLEQAKVSLLPTLLNSLAFQPTSTLSNQQEWQNIHFSRKLLMPHAHLPLIHASSSDSQPGVDSGASLADVTYFWVEHPALLHLEMDQTDLGGGIRLSLERHERCVADPLSGVPPLRALAGGAEGGGEKEGVQQQQQQQAFFLQLDEVVSAGPESIHPELEDHDNDPSHAAGFSPEHELHLPDPPNSHLGDQVSPNPRPHAETDVKGQPRGQQPQHDDEQQRHGGDMDQEEHACPSTPLFESTEPLISLHRYLLPGLYSLRVAETQLSMSNARSRGQYRSCPSYHLQFAFVSIQEMERSLLADSVCSAAPKGPTMVDAQFGSTADGADVQSGLDSWPPNLPPILHEAFLFDSMATNRSLYFQQRPSGPRVETYHFRAAQTFHFYAATNIDFHLASLRMELMRMDSKKSSVITYSSKATPHGHTLSLSFLPPGDYVLSLSESVRKMDETPEELRGGRAVYTVHGTDDGHSASTLPADHTALNCVPFAYRIELLPLSAYAGSHIVTSSEHAPSSSSSADTISDHASWKGRLLSDALHSSSGDFISSSLAAQQLLHVLTTSVPNYPFLPRTLCSPSYMRSAVSDEVRAEVFGVFSLNAIHRDEKSASGAGVRASDSASSSSSDLPPQLLEFHLRNDGATSNLIRFTLTTPSIFRLFAAPHINRRHPERSRAFTVQAHLKRAVATEDSEHQHVPPSELQTSAPDPHAPAEPYYWLVGVLQPGSYTLEIVPLPSPLTTLASSTLPSRWGRVQWFETLVQMELAPVGSGVAESAEEVLACSSASALEACVHGSSVGVGGAGSGESNDSAAEVPILLDFHQSSDSSTTSSSSSSESDIYGESFHHTSPHLAICPLHRGDRLISIHLHLTKRSELTSGVRYDFLSNDVILRLERTSEDDSVAGGIGGYAAPSPYAQGWGRDRWSGHRSQYGQELSAILPKGDYLLSVTSLGSLAKHAYALGCGSTLAFDAHVEPVTPLAGDEADANLAWGLVQARPGNIHVPLPKPQAHPAIQDTKLDDNPLSSTHSCPPYSLLPASLFDPRGSEANLHLEHSRHAARLHGERFEVNRLTTAQRFHYIKVEVEVASVLRIDLRTPTKEYERNLGIYAHPDDTTRRELVQPTSILTESPMHTTLLYVLHPDPTATAAGETHAVDAMNQPWNLRAPNVHGHATTFLLSVGATASDEEWTENECPFFAMDLVLVPLHQLKEHIVPPPTALPYPTTAPIGHPRAHPCDLLHNNAAQLSLPASEGGIGNLFKTLWWNGFQRSLELELTISPSKAAHGATLFIVLQHALISGLFQMELVSTSAQTGSATPATPASTNSERVHTFVAEPVSLVSGEREANAKRRRFHPVDLFFARDFGLELRALVAPGSYKLVIREMLAGELAKTLDVHADEMCLPMALGMRIQPYTPTESSSRDNIEGIIPWPMHLPRPAIDEVVVLAGSAEPLTPSPSFDVAIPATPHEPIETPPEISPLTDQHSGERLDIQPSLVHPLDEKEDEDAEGPRHQEPVRRVEPSHDVSADQSSSSSSSSSVSSDFVNTLRSRVHRLRMSEYTSIDLVVFSLAFLISSILCCVALAFHYRLWNAFCACVARCLPAVCPCLARWIIVRTGGPHERDIQLRKAIYYNYAGDDDNL